MTEERAKRKLTAMLSADVKGYSRLMGEDELSTVETLKRYRGIISSLVQQYSGRVVDSPGDNVLVEFNSVVDAVECAVRIQQDLKEKNASLPENRRMEFRIGVNLGDVIDDEGRIYGDGVNVAARVEGLAEGGGICISRTAFDQVKNKLKLGYEYLGEHSVKNIAEPVSVYKVLMEPEHAGKVIGLEEQRKRKWGWKTTTGVILALVVLAGVLLWNFYWRPPRIEPASMEKMTFPMPDLPSIAVLPFLNMSEDPNQEFLCDGITENIITALSKVPRLFVIARNSTFTYKGKPVKVKQVSEELGVQYVLEGSVQRSTDRIRITAQLIDALKGHHLWAERYDRKVTDLFALQDEITLKILKAIQVKLTEGETYWFGTNAVGQQDLDCYLKTMEALGHIQRANIEDTNIARRITEKTIATCPEQLKPYALMASIHMMDYWLGTSKSPRELIKKAIDLAQKSVAVDDTRAESHALLGQLYCLAKEWDKAIAEGEKGVALNPSGADVKYWYAATLTYVGRPEEAILLFEKAIRLNPFGPSRYFLSYGHALRVTGRFEEAVSAYKKAIQREPNNFFAHLNLAGTYSMMGRDKAAQDEAAEVLRLNPRFSLDFLAKVSGFKDRTETEKLITALRKAGLPDKPPLPLPDKPSIAVLPFTNMSEDKSQEFFSDGLTEEIITALSKTPKLFVIARNSSFIYKGKPVNVQQVSRELGVKHVLEGSVRRSGDQLRITAQLVEAPTGTNLWSERYERPMGEIFAVQDEITLAIVRAMRVTLTSGEQASLIGKGTKDLEAYLKAVEANEQFSLMNRQGSLKAKELAIAAISLDPKYAFPHAVLANAHMLDAWMRFGESYEESMKLANDAAHKALGLDDSDPYIHSALTNLYVMQRQYDKAIASAERALTLGPGASRSQSSMGIALAFSCRFNEALRFFEEAIRLDPYPPSPLFRLLGLAYSEVGRRDEALKAYENTLKLNPHDIFAHLSLAVLYTELGRDEQARAEVREVLRLHPKFSLDYFEKTLTFKDQSFVDRRVELLRKAGLK